MLKKMLEKLQILLIIIVIVFYDKTEGLRMRNEPLVGLASEHKRPNPLKYGRPDSRIIGGEQVEIVNSPWTVSIENQWYYHFCGGAIIHESVVLTAASCVAGLQAKNVRVLTGTSDWWNQTNPEYFVEKIALHCNFDKPLYHNDIALLKLKTQIKFDDATKAIPVADVDELQAGQKLTFTGWGTTVLGESYPQLLQKLEGTYLPYDSCKAEHNGSNDVDLGHVCVKQPLGQGICHGDSGGPLINENGELVGISNWGVPCAYGFPDVYARAAYYHDWIRTTLLSWELGEVIS